MTQAKTEKLPPMLDPHPTLRVAVDVVLDHDFERFSSGNMRMTLDRAEVSRDDQVVGHVAPVLPNGLVIKVGPRSYYLSPLSLWDAVEQAEREQSNE